MLKKIFIKNQNNLDLDKFGKVIKSNSGEFRLTARLSVLQHVKANGLRYETLGISELRLYQPIRPLQARDALGTPLNPQCFMTAC